MRNSLRKIFEDEEEEGQKKGQNINIAKSVFDFIKKRITRTELEESDDYIEDISGYSFDRANSTIYTKMTVKDFYEIIDLREEDEWVLKAHNYTSYYDFNIVDDYTTTDDFKMGYPYVWNRLDTTNIETLEKIAGIVYPEEPFNLSNEKYTQELNTRLLDMFEKEIDYIIGEFTYAENEAYVGGLRDKVNQKFWGPLKDSGIEVSGEYLSITAGYIIMFSRLLNYYGDLEGLMQRIIQYLLPKLETNWSEAQYDYYDSSQFDEVNYNRSAFRYLNEIEEQLLENENIGEYTDLVKRIRKKFKLDVWHKIPKTDDRSFKIKKIDPEDLKIEIQFQSNQGTISGTRLSEEDFYSFLYNYDLFDLG